MPMRLFLFVGMLLFPPRQYISRQTDSISLRLGTTHLDSKLSPVYDHVPLAKSHHSHARGDSLLLSCYSTSFFVVGSLLNIPTYLTDQYPT